MIRFYENTAADPSFRISASTWYNAELPSSVVVLLYSVVSVLAVGSNCRRLLACCGVVGCLLVCGSLAFDARC